MSEESFVVSLEPRGISADIILRNPARNQASLARTPATTTGSTTAAIAPTPTPAPAAATSSAAIATAPRRSWLEISRLPASSLHDLPENRRAAVVEARKGLSAYFAPPAPKRTPATTSADTTPLEPSSARPIPVPVYFRGVARGPIGHLRRRLQSCMPRWCILSLSFIGTNTLEVLCHKSLEARLISLMRATSEGNWTNIPNYNPTRSGASGDALVTRKRADESPPHNIFYRGFRTGLKR